MRLGERQKVLSAVPVQILQIGVRAPCAKPTISKRVLFLQVELDGGQFILNIGHREPGQGDT